MSEWYYTTNRERMGPVSVERLQQLAASGQLQPSDLVWTEGMAEWALARTRPELFPAPLPRDSAIRADAVRPARYEDLDDRGPRRPRLEDDDPDRRGPTSRSRENDDWDRTRTGGRDDDEFAPRPRPRKSSNALVIVLVVCGVLVVLGLAIVGIVLVAGSSSTSTRSFNLKQNELKFWHMSFSQGQVVDIRVLSHNQSDVDLYVFDAKGEIVAFDVGDSKDCFVRFEPAATQQFKVEVRNMMRNDQPWRNGPNSGTLTCIQEPKDQIGQLPPPPAIQQPANFPTSINPGKGTVSAVLTAQDLGDMRHFNTPHKAYFYAMTSGKTYVIDLESKDFDAFLRLENEAGAELAHDDDSGGNLNAQITFTPTQTGIYRIVVTYLNNPKAPGPGKGNFTLKIRP